MQLFNDLHSAQTRCEQKSWMRVWAADRRRQDGRNGKVFHVASINQLYTFCRSFGGGNFYEIITPKSPARLYLDIDYRRQTLSEVLGSRSEIERKIIDIVSCIGIRLNVQSLVEEYIEVTTSDICEEECQHAVVLYTSVLSKHLRKCFPSWSWCQRLGY